MDKDSNNFSVINVIEEVGLPVEPPSEGSPESTEDRRHFSPANFEMVVLWARTDEKTSERGRGRIVVELPNRSQVLSPEIDVDLTKFLRLRSRINFPGFPDGGIGRYHFVVQYKSSENEWEPKFTYPLRVTQKPLATPEPKQAETA